MTVLDRRADVLPGRADLVIWGSALVAAAAAGAAIAARPVLLAAAAALAVALAGAVLLLAQPRWVLVGAVAVLVAHAVAVLRAEVGLPLTLRSLVLLILIGVAARYVVGVDMPSWPQRETAILGAFGAALLLSVPFAADSARALVRVVELGDGAVLALLMVVLLDRVLWLRRALWAYLAAAAALAALAVVQQVTGTYGVTYGGFANVAEDGSLLRSTGPIDANYLGQLLVAAAAVALYLALDTGRRSTRLLAGAAGATCLAGLAFTFSRGALLTAVVVLGAVAWLRRARPWLPLAALVGIVAAGLLFLPGEARDRMTALVRPAQEGVAVGDPSIRGRFSENLAALRMFRDHPFVGVGPDNYPERYLEYSQEIGLDPRREERHAHNLYLEALAEYGAIGAAAFFTVLGAALRGALAARRLSGGGLVAEGAAVALLAFLVNGLFLQASYPHYLWLTIGLALAAGRIAARSAEPRA